MSNGRVPESLAPLQFSSDDFMVLVFRLPEQVPSDFCFGGGWPVNFQLIDWFEGRYPGAKVPVHINEIRQEVRLKRYYKPGQNLLCMRRDGACFLVDEPK